MDWGVTTPSFLSLNVSFFKLLNMTKSAKKRKKRAVPLQNQESIDRQNLFIEEMRKGKSINQLAKENDLSVETVKNYIIKYFRRTSKKWQSSYLLRKEIKKIEEEHGHPSNYKKGNPNLNKRWNPTDIHLEEDIDLNPQRQSFTERLKEVFTADSRYKLEKLINKKYHRFLRTPGETWRKEKSKN